MNLRSSFLSNLISDNSRSSSLNAHLIHVHALGVIISPLIIRHQYQKIIKAILNFHTNFDMDSHGKRRLIYINCRWRTTSRWQRLRLLWGLNISDMNIRIFSLQIQKYLINELTCRSSSDCSLFLWNLSKCRWSYNGCNMEGMSSS
jgi:hypothetical protein